MGEPRVDCLTTDKHVRIGAAILEPGHGPHRTIGLDGAREKGLAAIERELGFAGVQLLFQLVILGGRLGEVASILRQRLVASGLIEQVPLPADLFELLPGPIQGDLFAVLPFLRLLWHIVRGGVLARPVWYGPAAEEYGADQPPAGCHGQNAGRREGQLLGIEGNLKTPEQLRPERTAAMPVTGIDFLVSHAKLL